MAPITRTKLAKTAKLWPNNFFRRLEITKAHYHLTRIRLHLAIYFLPFRGEAIERLHGANCAELFGI